MPFVKLRDDIKGTFRRSVRDVSGAIIETLEFPSGQVVDVPWEKLDAIRNDFYHALMPVKPLFQPQKPGDTSPPVPNGKWATIPKDELEKLLSGESSESESPTEPDDDELEKLTAPEPIAVDVSELPLSPQMAEAIKPPEPGVSSGTQPTRRPRK